MRTPRLARVLVLSLLPACHATASTGADVPNDPLVRAAALLAAGQREQALESYRTAAEPGAERRLEAMVGAARILRLAGQGPVARATLEEALALYRDGIGVDRVGETVAAGRAAALLGASDPSRFIEALDLFEAAIRLDPQHAAAKLALADLLLSRYNNREALPLYREVLKTDAENPQALFGLARSQYFDHSRAALDTVRRALELAPDLAPARVFLARLLLDSGDFDGVGRELDKVLETDPVHPGALTIRAAAALLQFDQAAFEASVEAVTSTSPGYSEMYADLAEIAAENRLYQDAIDIARRGARQHPDDSRARALLGVNLFRLGRVREGRRHLEAAFRGDPYDVWVKNTLDLINGMREFVVVRQGRFELVARERDAAVLGTKLFPLAERAFEFFQQRYGYTPPTPVRIEFYDRRDDFSVRTVGLVGLDLLGVSFGPVVSLVSPAELSGQVNWGSVLWHELAHTFHLSMTRSRVPRWFTEGLAVVEEHLANPGWGNDVDEKFLAAWKQGKLPPASRLDEAFTRPSYRGQVVHAYFLSSLLINYIEQHHGIGAIRAMLSGYGEGKNTETLFAEVLGTGASDLDDAFATYVGGRYAHVIDELGLADGGGSAYRASLEAGRKALDQGDPDTAHALLADARHRVPELAGPESPYHLLARLHAGRGETDLAIRELESIVAIDADQLAPLSELARLYREAGRPAAAAGALERALFINPFDATIRERLAEIQENNGDFEAAVDQRRAVIDLGPEDSAGAYYRLALSLDGAGDAEAARGEVLRALEAAPMYDDALELLLRIRAALGYEDSLDSGALDPPDHS